MKLNKEQRLALVTRIKQLTKEEQNKFIEQVEKAWMPSDNYIALKKQLKKLQKEIFPANFSWERMPKI